MKGSKAGSQTIECMVTSCRYNDNGSHCDLECIEVQPCSECHTGKAEDESLCGSYRQR